MDLWQMPVTDVRELLVRERTELLAWLGGLTSDGWRAPSAAPGWTVKDLAHIAHDLTERWVHQMQMRIAVDQVGGYAADHLADVLHTFVWAFPHQYRAPAPAGTAVLLDLGVGGTWTLTCDRARHGGLDPGAPARSSAAIYASDDCGSRWLTGAQVPEAACTQAVPGNLCGPC